MKDMFDREINVNDIVVYATRSGSTQNMMIARVIKTTEKNVRVMVLAGNSYEWKTGTMKWDDVTKTYSREPMSGYEASLTASNNVMIANGLGPELAQVHDQLVETQRKSLASRTV